jgi:small subunit ribosomal protein S13
MSEEKQEPQKKPQRPGLKDIELVKLVRILQKDIKGTKKLYHGLCEIKGVSWAFSNAVVKILKLDKNKRIQDLSGEEIKRIEELLRNPESMPLFLINRKNDRDSGEDKHLVGTDWDLQKEFDIKRMKKIKSYKGVRHAAGQPVRGQRTKSHFRKNKKKSGMKGGSDSKAKSTVTANKDKGDKPEKGAKK